MAKMFFAKQKDTGKIVSVDEVEKGLACNCICPHCGATLEAKKGKVNVHHFAHYDKDDTSFCSESALHLAAKEVLKEERKIMLPSLRVGHNHFEVLPDKYIFRYNSIDVEKSVSVDGEIIRPDVIVYNENAKLAIEILVSHAVDDEKKEKIKRAKLTTVEISLDIDDILNKETLRIFLISKISNKKWIFSNQRNYFADKIPQICKKFIVENKFVRDCPLNIWQGRKLGASISQCNSCKYGYGVSLEHVLCLGEKRIARIDDLKLNAYELQEHIRKQKMEEMDDDKKVFLRGICPVCHSGLRVGKADDPYIGCRNYKECNFTAGIDLVKYTAIFKNRVGENVVVDLPEFVLNGVLQLQKGAAEEIDNIEKLFPLGLCPYCAERLVIRDGKRGKFLGCKGYSNFDYSCQFTANLDFENMTATFQTRYSPKRTIVKTIPENVIREYKMWKERKEAPRRQFLISENDRRDD